MWNLSRIFYASTNTTDPPKLFTVINVYLSFHCCWNPEPESHILLEAAFQCSFIINKGQLIYVMTQWYQKKLFTVHRGSPSAVWWLYFPHNLGADLKPAFVGDAHKWISTKCFFLKYLGDLCQNVPIHIMKTLQVTAPVELEQRQDGWLDTQ